MKKLIVAVTLVGLLTMGAFAQGTEKKPAEKPAPAAKGKAKGKKKTTATPTPTPAPKK